MGKIIAAFRKMRRCRYLQYGDVLNADHSRFIALGFRRSMEMSGTGSMALYDTSMSHPPHGQHSRAAIR